MVTQKQGRQLKIGDVLFVGSRDFMITSFSPHPGFNGQSARIVNYLGGRVTIFDDEWFAEDRASRHHRVNAER